MSHEQTPLRAGTGPLLHLALYAAANDHSAAAELARRLDAERFPTAIVTDAELAAGDVTFQQADLLLLCLSSESAALPEVMEAVLATRALWAGAIAGEREVVLVCLDGCEPPAGFGDMPSISLGVYGGYERLMRTLWSRMTALRRAREAAPPPPVPPVPEKPVPPPVGVFTLPDLEHAGQFRRLGHGVALRAIPLPEERLLVIGMGGAALAALPDGVPSWQIDTPTRCGALNPDGDLLALGLARQIRLWEIHSGKLRATLTGLPTGVTCLALSATLLLAGTSDGALLLWRIDGPNPLVEPLDQVTAHREAITTVALSPDGRHFASASADRSVRLWRLLDRSLAHTFNGHAGAVEALAFSPDGALLASGARDRSVRVWRSADRAVVATLTGHTGVVEALAFSPDGTLLASAGDDRTARIWAFADGNQCGLPRMLTHPGPVASLAFSTDSTTLVTTARDGSIRLWETATATARATLQIHTSAISTLTFSPDSRSVVTGHTDGTIRFWDEGIEVERQIAAHTGAVTLLAFADPALLLSASADRSIALWNGSDGALQGRFTVHGPVRGGALAPGGALLALASDESRVWLWRIEDGALVADLTDLVSRAGCVVFTPDGRGLLAGSASGTLWHWETRAPDWTDHPGAARAFSGHNNRVRCLACSPEGILASAGDDGTIRLWRIATGETLRTFDGPGGPLTALAFSPDNTLLVAGSQAGVLRIWRLPGEPLAAMQAHAAAITTLGFSPDGTGFASGSSDGTVRLWKTP